MTVAVHLVEHPLIADSLTRVRDKDTPNALFRQELERIGTLLIAEATRGLATHEVRVTTPLVATSGRALSSQPVVVPVLRAGLGMLALASGKLREVGGSLAIVAPEGRVLQMLNLTQMTAIVKVCPTLESAAAAL